MNTLAIYRQAFLGAIGALVGYAAVRSQFGAYPAETFGTLAAQYAVLAVCIALALGLRVAHQPLVKPQTVLLGALVAALVAAVSGVAAAGVGWLFATMVPRLIAASMGWACFAGGVGAAAGVGLGNRHAAGRGTLAGLVAGLFAGSTLELLAVVLPKTAIEPRLAATMAHVYGLGLLGLCVGGFDELAAHVGSRVWLRFESGPWRGRSRALDGRAGPLRIGSGSRCGLRLEAGSDVVEDHAEIQCDGDAYRVVARGGVVFAAARGAVPAPTAAHSLADGDLICIGPYRMRFHTREGAP